MPKKITIASGLRQIMSKGKKWWMPHEMQSILHLKHDHLVSESSITAVTRTMPDVLCTVRKYKKADGSTGSRWQYCLVK